MCGRRLVSRKAPAGPADHCGRKFPGLCRSGVCRSKAGESRGRLHTREPISGWKVAVWNGTDVHLPPVLSLIAYAGLEDGSAPRTAEHGADFAAESGARDSGRRSGAGDDPGRRCRSAGTGPGGQSDSSARLGRTESWSFLRSTATATCTITIPSMYERTVLEFLRGIKVANAIGK